MLIYLVKLILLQIIKVAKVLNQEKRKKSGFKSKGFALLYSAKEDVGSNFLYCTHVKRRF